MGDGLPATGDRAPWWARWGRRDETLGSSGAGGREGRAGDHKGRPYGGVRSTGAGDRKGRPYGAVRSTGAGGREGRPYGGVRSAGAGDREGRPYGGVCSAGAGAVRFRRAGLLLLCAVLPCVAQAAPLVGRAVAFAQPNSVWDQEWQRVKAGLAAQDDVRLEYFTRGERGSEEQMLHDIRRGRAHLGGMSLQGLASVVPELNIAMAPYVFDSAGEVDFVYDNYLFDVFDPLFAAKNLALLQWVEVGWSGIYSQRPIALPSDARGLRLRGSPNPAAQAFLAAIDADSIPLGSGDLVPSLQTGLIEGGVSSVIFHFFVTRKYATHLTLSRHSYDTGAIVVNRRWFESATEAQREVLRRAWGDAGAARAAVRAVASFAVEEMRQEGIAVRDLTDTELDRWRQATADIVPALIGDIGGGAQAVHDAIVAGKRVHALRATDG